MSVEERDRWRVQPMANRRAGGTFLRVPVSHPHPRSVARWWRHPVFSSRPSSEVSRRITSIARADRPRHPRVSKQARDPFEALADPTRRGILELLRDQGVVTAGDIAETFPEISRPAVSRHLRVLRESGIVEAEQIGREWRYRIDGAMLALAYRDWFERFAPLWEQSLARLKEQVESDGGTHDA